MNGFHTVRQYQNWNPGKTEDPDGRRIEMIPREEGAAIRTVATREGVIKFEWP
jgi:hypothetical protein